MTDTHTPGPWHVNWPICYGHNPAKSIFLVTQPRGGEQDQGAIDAARIAACVNACEGIDDVSDTLNVMSEINYWRDRWHESQDALREAALKLDELGAEFHARECRQAANAKNSGP